MNLRLIALVVCAGLVVTNIFTARAYLSERDAATQAGEQLADATRDAQACSAGVDSLQVTAAAQAASAAKELKAAQARARIAEKRAAEIIASGPSQPGNDCASANDRMNEWITERSHSAQD